MSANLTNRRVSLGRFAQAVAISQEIFLAWRLLRIAISLLVRATNYPGAQQMTSRIFSPLAALLFATVVLVSASARADIVFTFVCTSPADCDGDASFRFDLRFADTIVGGSTVYGFSSQFLGFAGQSSVGDGFAISGNSATGSFIAFTFDLGLTEITDLENLGTGAWEVGYLGIGGQVDFVEGTFYYLNKRVDLLPSYEPDGTYIEGRFVRVPEPMSLGLLGVGLLALGLAARRRRTSE